MTKAVMRDTEAAEYLGVSRASIWNLVARDAFPRVFVGGCTRFRRADIDAYLERQSVNTEQAAACRPERHGQRVLAARSSKVARAGQQVSTDPGTEAGHVDTRQ